MAMAPAARATTGSEKFSRADVVARAKALAERPFKARSSVPDDWLAMSYDQYRSIQFDVDKALWANTDRSYNVDFFLPGLYFERPVLVHAVEDGISTSIPFDIGRFKTHPEISPELSQEGPLGYSGFRLRTDLGDRDHPGKKTEFCVFQGASYFRAIANGNNYGLSARGLALKTADPEGEEFPEFVSFWLEAPGPPARQHGGACADGQPVRDGRLSVRHHPRQSMCDGCRSDTVPAQRPHARRACAFDIDVPV